MPELPDITVYLEHLDRRIRGATLTQARVAGLNLLRTFEPPLTALEGREVIGLRRMGKRIVFAFDQDLFMVLHLMIAGRLLADRGLSRLLKADWPRTLEELEERRRG